jgi:hypothetical protein
MTIRRRHRLVQRTYSVKEPNCIWHVDGYDKLKPYGIFISGCVDSYPRKVLRLKAGTTNNDPALVVGYFIEAIDCFEGHPERVRTDFDSENVTICAIQTALRANNPSSFVASANTNEIINVLSPGGAYFVVNARSTQLCSRVSNIMDILMGHCPGISNPRNALFNYPELWCSAVQQATCIRLPLSNCKLQVVMLKSFFKHFLVTRTSMIYVVK